MTDPFVIEPDAWYDAPSLRLETGIGESTLARARREGRLRSTRRGGRTLYRGAWILDWLTSAESPEQPAEPVGAA